MKIVTIGHCTLIHTDCMDVMREMQDKAFDLAITDPPYGIGISSNPVRQMHSKKSWDFEIPQNTYFDSLKRVSINQIIWGGNYFLDYLGATQCFIIWDKIQPHDFSLAMCELAWTSIQSPAKMWRRSVLAEKDKIHPTQKPCDLYSWLLTNYAKPGQTILDTHLGSGSSAIAANKLGFSFTGIELDEDYFNAACERIENAYKQVSLFDVEPDKAEIKQESLL